MTYAIEPELLITKLIQEILAANLDWETNTPWTRAVKLGLAKILEREGGLTDVLFSDPEHGITEFLLDVVAWDREAGEGIALAAECEWISTASELIRDFEKLLVVKSPLKLMVFASHGKAAGEQGGLIQALHKSFLTYKHHVAGERYIFLDFAKPPARRAYWFEVPENGKLQTIPHATEVEISQMPPG